MTAARNIGSIPSEITEPPITTLAAARARWREHGVLNQERNYYKNPNIMGYLIHSLLPDDDYRILNYIFWNGYGYAHRQNHFVTLSQSQLSCGTRKSDGRLKAPGTCVSESGVARALARLKKANILQQIKGVGTKDPNIKRSRGPSGATWAINENLEEWDFSPFFQSLCLLALDTYVDMVIEGECQPPRTLEQLAALRKGYERFSSVISPDRKRELKDTLADWYRELVYWGGTLPDPVKLTISEQADSTQNNTVTGVRLTEVSVETGVTVTPVSRDFPSTKYQKNTETPVSLTPVVEETPVSLTPVTVETPISLTPVIDDATASVLGKSGGLRINKKNTLPLTNKQLGEECNLRVTVPFRDSSNNSLVPAPEKSENAEGSLTPLPPDGGPMENNQPEMVAPKRRGRPKKTTPSVQVEPVQKLPGRKKATTGKATAPSYDGRPPQAWIDAFVRECYNGKTPFDFRAQVGYLHELRRYVPLEIAVKYYKYRQMQLRGGQERTIGIRYIVSDIKAWKQYDYLMREWDRIHGRLDEEGEAQHGGGTEQREPGLALIGGGHQGNGRRLLTWDDIRVRRPEDVAHVKGFFDED